MRNSDRYHGTLLVNKPLGFSSHDTVMKVRRIVRQRSIGHTGTLDPLADGLMILCLGRATKVSRFLTDRDKTYEAEIHLGLTSVTYDAEGVDANLSPREIPALSDAEVNAVLREFVGITRQRVPAYSAVHVDGRRLYELARRGETVAPPQREVHIRSIKLLEFNSPHLRIRVDCGKGTYIRTLAHEIGQRLGCGGYLSRLTRTSVGRMHLDDALTLEALEEVAKLGQLEDQLVPIEEVLDFSAILVSDQFSEFVVNGPQLRKDDVVGINGHFAAGERVLLKNQQGTVLAIGTAGVDSEHFASANGEQLFSYTRVLN